MKIPKSRIQKESSPQSYRRGVHLHKQHKVYNIREDENEMENTFHISAQVGGSAGYSYHVFIDYDTDTKLFYDYECECPAFYQYDKMCKHCVAAALQFAEEDEKPQQLEFQAFLKGTKAASKKIQTSTEIANLIYAYSVQDKARYLQPDLTGSIDLEPTLHMNYNGWSVDFKIGAKTKYVLKDIHAFLHALESREKVEYGKKLGFIHEMSAFTEEAQEIIKFLTKYMGEYRYYTQSGYRISYYPVMRAFPLSDDARGDFLHLMLGKTCYLDDYYSTDTSITIRKGNPELPVILREVKEKSIFELKLPPMQAFYGNRRLYVRLGGVIYECETSFSASMKDICSLGMLNQYRILSIHEKDMSSLCSSLLPILQEHTNLTVEGDVDSFLPQEAVIKIHFDYQKEYITARLEAQYGEDVYNVLGTFEVSDAFRDTQKESHVAYTVRMYFEGLTPENELYISGQNEELIYKLLTTGMEQISRLGEIYISEEFKKLNVVKAPKVNIGIAITGDLLDLTIDAGRLSSEDLNRFLGSYRKRKKYFRLKNGDFMEIEDNSIAGVSELVDGLQLSVKELEQKKIKVPRYRAFYMDQILKDKGEDMEILRDRPFKSLIRNMKSVEDSDYEVPENLALILRKYQKIGFRWLCTLDAMGFGGILADDMGLGKTLQVISFLFYKVEMEDSKKVSLIVCPASLVYNWQSEIEKFAPQLSVLMPVGSLSERQAQLKEYKNYDVVITSYDLLKRDVETYKGLSFYAEIIDEAQNIKNQATQSAKAVKSITAATKFALTGTPIENRLSELWSIFDYLMPGFLGSYQRFKTDYETPIVVNRDEIIIKRLQKMIRPFILRRVKSDVLKELPEKEESIIYTKLEGKQLALYNAHVQRMLDTLAGQTESEFANGKFQILAELTRLRQICCAPAMVYENYNGEAAKLDTCMELIKNSIEGGHKTLLFSQFTSLFMLLEEKLKAENIAYYKLTGATSKLKRAEMVREFNENGVPIFLISLKAGGTGLNLTGASIVIHLDPWWNVAAQNQATDRAHRIGQKSTVSVFKLIAKNTIEEKIVKLQESKKDLSDQIISGEGVSVSNLTKEDFMGILE